MNRLNPFIRWLLFVSVGLPMHWVFMLLYVPVYFICRTFFLYKKAEQKADYSHVSAAIPIMDTDKNILINSDDHNMLTQWTVAKSDSFRHFVYNKGDGLTFMRVPNPISKKAFDEVSGDCIVSFAFAMANAEKDVLVKNRQIILELAKTYLKNLGCLSYDEKNNGTVSSRCNNFGINWCPDGWGQLGQPAFGPQYFTSSSLFAIAAKVSLTWRMVYHLHRILMGGFIFEWMPLVVPKNSLFYVRDITAKAIFVHEYVFGLKAWMIKAYDEISRSVEFKNPVLCALARRYDYDYSTIPNYVNRFFGQSKTGTSEYDDSSIPKVKQSLVKLSQR